jgi:hypothetical protein
MSDASQSIDSLQVRPLREEERQLISFLLSGTATKMGLKDNLATARVVDLKDGHMGSIRFVQTEARVFGQALVEAECTDADGVCLSIAINADNKGDLFEVDFWKVDFSPLKRYPRPSDLRPSGSTASPCANPR